MPVVIGAGGVERIVEIELDADERGGVREIGRGGQAAVRRRAALSDGGSETVLADNQQEGDGAA